MKINGKEYIKVRNVQEHEIGWAYQDNGKLILDNDLGKMKAGSVIKVDQNRDIIECKQKEVKKCKEILNLKIGVLKKF